MKAEPWTAGMFAVLIASTMGGCSADMERSAARRDSMEAGPDLSEWPVASAADSDSVVFVDPLHVPEEPSPPPRRID